MSESTKVHELQPGTIVGGRYRLGEQIGHGGMGVVYAAESLGCMYAIKFLRTTLENSNAYMRRFLREAQTIRSFQSDNVVNVFAADTDLELGMPYIVMEMLHGADLGEWLQWREHLPPGPTVRLFLQACYGLDAAHRHGVVHRDIKPGNLFLHETHAGALVVKICDFGLAKILEMDAPDVKQQTSLTHTRGGLLGSPMYMSPEQVRDPKRVDPRTDVWSLGAALYEALSGCKLWDNSLSIGELILSICTRAPTHLGVLAPWLDPGLADAVHGALVQDRAYRYQSMAAFAEALVPFADAAAQITSQDLLAGAPSRVNKPSDPLLSTALIADPSDSRAGVDREGVADAYKPTLVAESQGAAPLDSQQASVRDSGRGSVRDSGRGSVRDSGRGSVRDSGRTSRGSGVETKAWHGGAAGVDAEMSSGRVLNRNETAESAAQNRESAAQRSGADVAVWRFRWPHIAGVAAMLAVASFAVAIYALLARDQPSDQVAAVAPPMPSPAQGDATASVDTATPRNTRSGFIDAERLQSFTPLPAFVARVNTPRTGPLVDLGRMLYYDARLSGEGDRSCQTCHDLQRYGIASADAPGGPKGAPAGRDIPGVYNAAGNFRQHWDGRYGTVEEQIRRSIGDPYGMASSAEVVVRQLRSIPGYVEAFALAFPRHRRPVRMRNVATAIGAFMRQLMTPGRWDAFLRGDNTALTLEERRGFNLFVDVGCVTCHFGPYVGATMFQKLGLIRAWPDRTDMGRYAITRDEADRMVFKVPSLRNVGVTGPYFHDGSVDSLERAVALMAEHQLGKDLRKEEVADITAWLHALTGEIPHSYIEKPALPKNGRRTRVLEPR